MAALFNPLRRRIQSFTDRRFYIRKYDPRKTLEAFSARLRGETGLDVLSNDRLGVIGEAMRSEHVYSWLSPDRISKRKQADWRTPHLPKGLEDAHGEADRWSIHASRKTPYDKLANRNGY